MQSIAIWIYLPFTEAKALVAHETTDAKKFCFKNQTLAIPEELRKAPEGNPHYIANAT
jgi:hypothetical protein